MEWEAKWLPHDQPVPEGWALASNEGMIRDHHAHYARLIVRKIVGELHDDTASDNPSIG
jgi:hypothetical protein